MKSIASAILVLAKNIQDYWANKIKERYNIQISSGDPGKMVDPIISRETYQILSTMTEKLIGDCNITDIFIKDLGPSMAHYPNHGFYRSSDNSITMNVNVYTSPDQPEDFWTEYGTIDRASHTLSHEIGHSLDHNLGINRDLSLREDWLKLSGWSKEPKPGLKKLIINEPGMPPVIGEMHYSPSAKFVRFYAKRNPWDDWADSFSFYVSGLRDKVPDKKRQYFDNLLKKYYK